MSSNRYTYGVIEQAPLDIDVTGVDGAPIDTVDYRSLSAVVSEIGTIEPERTDENAAAHDEVLRAVLQSDGGRTIIPMRFGMVFKTENALKNVLRNGRVAFRRSLNDLDGMVELGVKLVAKEGSTVDRRAVVEDVATRLRAVADTEAGNDLYSDRLVFNRAYLVDRADQPAFEETVAAIRDAYDDSLLVQYNGPWAPYNFVDIEIGAEGR
ncbi:GvpL/GvpF family gas vesicle protein [Halohasta salina]|uniref:GvpL/GvpF family gas vesicle protein n=1 Tax=Halohasta salina TaxID=2961621 RepID=UPI0020A52512|nr:GvpL/GvpF family gas vesicle protein [Halohasta salina]